MDVKWIKITTNMFDDEKIDFIESLPEADGILVVWIKLLTMAGRNNSNGFIFLTEQIPYNTEMLAHKFRRPLNTVKLALETLRKLEMITFDDDGFLKITNWEKHQNIEGLEKIREQTRLRVAKYRDKKQVTDGNVTCNVTVTQGNATEGERELELEKEQEQDKDIDKEIVVIDHKEPKKTTAAFLKNLIEEWNGIGLPTKLTKIAKNTSRFNMLHARVQEYGEEEVMNAVRGVKESSFLQGNNNKGWIITFDWFIKPNNFIKVLEGNYKDKEVPCGKTQDRGDKPDPFAKFYAK